MPETSTGVTSDDVVARATLPEYGFSANTGMRMINLSENATYLVDDPQTGRGGILRVHRKDYHPRESIESELMWLDALRQDSVISTPVVIPASDGRRVVAVEHEGTERYAVLFHTIAGLEPDERDVGASDFRTLGELTAKLHQHTRAWQRPPGFQRFSWTWETTLGDTPRWGRWRDGIGIGVSESDLLGRAAALVRTRLADYGNGPDRFGLVHADLRLANLLVDGDQINVIDFDDCGFSWYLYDFGTAVSFIEDDPHLAEWQDAWVAGYRDHAELSSADEEMLATYVMLRRMMLVAWMGSHSHSKECQEKGPDYARGSCELAERYLSSGGQRL